MENQRMVNMMRGIGESVADISRHGRYRAFGLGMADIIQMGANVATGRELLSVIRVRAYRQ